MLHVVSYRNKMLGKHCYTHDNVCPNNCETNQHSNKGGIHVFRFHSNTFLITTVPHLLRSKYYVIIRFTHPVNFCICATKAVIMPWGHRKKRMDNLTGPHQSVWQAYKAQSLVKESSFVSWPQYICRNLLSGRRRAWRKCKCLTRRQTLVWMM